MGLDMYLDRSRKIKGLTLQELGLLSAYFDLKDYTKRTGEKCSLKDWCGHTESELPSKKIIENYKKVFGDCLTTPFHEVGYWRKANAIHNWFVNNVQNGNDNCQRYEVSKEQLEALLDSCKQVLSSEMVETELLSCVKCYPKKATQEMVNKDCGEDVSFEYFYHPEEYHILISDKTLWKKYIARHPKHSYKEFTELFDKSIVDFFVTVFYDGDEEEFKEYLDNDKNISYEEFAENCRRKNPPVKEVNGEAYYSQGIVLASEPEEAEDGYLCEKKDAYYETSIYVTKEVIGGNKASCLLPTQSGFFFGPVEYDKWYVQTIKETVEILEDVLSSTDFEKETTSYIANW